MHVIKNHGAKIFLIFPLSLESFFSLSLFPSFIFLLFDAAQKGFALFLISFQASYLIIIVRSRDVKNTENRFSFPRLLFFERNVYDMVYIIIRYIYIYSRVVIAKTMITITGFDILSILSLLPGASSIIYDFVYSPSTDRIAVKHGVMHIEDVVRGLKERETERCIPRHWVTWWTFFFFFFFLLPSLRINDRDRLYTHACAIVSRIKKIVDR